jgi:hypothetical protein
LIVSFFIFLIEEEHVLNVDGVFGWRNLKEDPADISPKAFLEFLVWQFVTEITTAENTLASELICQSISTFPLSGISVDLSITDRKHS